MVFGGWLGLGKEVVGCSSAVGVCLYGVVESHRKNGSLYYWDQTELAGFTRYLQSLNALKTLNKTRLHSYFSVLH